MRDIKPSDILKFPVEWHDAIQTHAIGALSGASGAFDDGQSFSAPKPVRMHSTQYIVRMTQHSHALVITTYDWMNQHHVANGFPLILHSDGSYYYTRNQVRTKMGDLPYEYSNQGNGRFYFKWMRRINGPSVESANSTDMEWNSHNKTIMCRKKYIDSTMKSGAAFMVSQFNPDKFKCFIKVA